jgi:hypothetical protein
LHAVYVQNYRYAYWDGRAGQGAGRWAHVAFWAAVTAPAALALPAAIGGAPGAATALPILATALLYGKVTRNTKRSSAKTLPKPLDLCVYFVTTTGSVLGYLAGVLHRTRERRR